MSRLIPFKYDNTKVNPNEVAIKNRQMFIIEKIIKHTGNPKELSKMLFLIKWKGYDESENTWEPLKNLRNNIKLIEYAKTKNLYRLIPKEYLTDSETNNEHSNL